MADQTQGYSCEFIDSVSEDFYCKKCTLVARRLSITTCCGESFCYSCIADTQEQSKPCPECDKEYNTVEHVKNQKRINCLRVYCSMKERGCGWSETLDRLDTHLDPDQDNCQYVDTKCPLNCNMTIPKNKVEQHVAQHCAKRPHVCQYCSFKATYEEVVNTHLPECKRVPLWCPNLCGVTFERKFMEDHMKMCHLEEVGCEFSGVGCEERFRREDQEEHTRQNSQKHLTLAASLAKQLQQKLEEQENKHREEKQVLKMKIEEQEKKIEEQGMELKNVSNQLLSKTFGHRLQEVLDFFKRLKAKSEHSEASDITKKLEIERRTFEVNYSREAKNEYTSTAMYTHLDGYKFCVKVYVSALNHLCVTLCSMPGDCDDQLQWPAKAKFTIELINQQGGEDMVSPKYTWIWNKPEEESNTTSGTCILETTKVDDFLVNDTLHFRITKVELI